MKITEIEHLVLNLWLVGQISLFIISLILIIFSRFIKKHNFIIYIDKIENLLFPLGDSPLEITRSLFLGILVVIISICFIPTILIFHMALSFYDLEE